MTFPRRTSPCVVVQEMCAPRGRGLLFHAFDTSAILIGKVSGRRGSGWRLGYYGEHYIESSQKIMAEGGPSPDLFAEVEEPSISRKYVSIESLFERLVQETKIEVRDSAQKLFERGAIDREQKESVIKTLSRHHLETDYAASSLFEHVLNNVERDDRHFDRLLLALRDLEFFDIADDLLQASKLHPLDPAPEQAMEHNFKGSDMYSNDPSDGDPPPKKKIDGEELSLYDSGIAPQSFYLSASSGVSAFDDYSQLFSSPHGQPNREVNELQQPESSMNESPSPPQEIPPEEEEGEEPPSLSSDDIDNSPQHDTSMMHELSSDVENSLQSHPQLQEPETDDDDDDYNQLTPIQAHSDESSSMLVVSQAGNNVSTSVTQEVGESSNELVDQLSHRLTEMRLELQHKERELQARAQEMQQNSDLLARCKELEEQVRRMEDEVKAQKSRADKVANEKDIEINSWKKQCEEKECEIRMFRVTIARQEREKMELAKAHRAEIVKLQKRQRESAHEIEEYDKKVAALDAALKEATQKKEVAEQQLKEADSKIKEAEAEQYKAVIKLLENMCAKEKELSQLKEANLKLTIEIKELECRNKCLVVETKEQEALLHQKDRELAEHRQAAAEEKHNTCARELKSERRQSKQLQDENNELKRQLSEYQEKISAQESLAKRSKTN